MAENVVKPITLNKPKPPIELFKQTFCKHCNLKCLTNTLAMQNCILTLLTDETTRLRQTIQQRTQHLIWWTTKDDGCFICK
ncbi:MAG: hypothetical protein QW493_01920 [Candidatus Bathyarchaeia archaeon]